jgi:hypothetical protein
MRNSVKHIIFLGFTIACMSGTTISIAQPDTPNLLDSLGRGMWQFRAVGGGATGTEVNRLCVGDISKLAQVQHQGLNCQHYVVRSAPNSITISYSCRGQGQGLTVIRKETSKLVHIDSQGIRNNSPFSFSVEARNTGPCNP